MAKEPTPYVAAPRRLPDVSRQVFNGADAAKNRAAVNDRVIELGDELSDVQSDLFELQQRQIIAETFNQIVSNSDALAAEAIGVQRDRAAADRESRANAANALTNGLAKLGACIVGAVKTTVEARLAQQETVRQLPAERAEAPQIGRATINRELLNKTAAISAARPAKTAALPSPSSAPALPAPSKPQVAARPAPLLLTHSRPAIVVRKRIFNNAE